MENCNLYYILFSGELPPSSGHWDSLRSLLGLLEEYKDRAPRYTIPGTTDKIGDSARRIRIIILTCIDTNNRR